MYCSASRASGAWFEAFRKYSVHSTTVAGLSMFGRLIPTKLMVLLGSACLKA